MRRLSVLVGVAALWLGVTAVPSFGDDSGTVSATVSTPAPCLTLDEETIDFGTHPFSPGGINGHVAGPITVSDCSGVQQDLLVSGTNASSTTSPTTWSLTDASDPCTVGLDVFRAHVGGSIGLSSPQNLLPGIFRDIGIVPAGGSNQTTPVIFMPCVGSSGQGESMTFDIFYLVTIP